MHIVDMNYFPLALPFFLFLVGLFVIVLSLLEIGILHYAYSRIGIGSRHALTVLMLSLLGSYINIPVAQLRGEPVLVGQNVDFYGIQYVIPVVKNWPGTVIAVNVGGALIPTLLSIYLVIKNRLYGLAMVGTAIVAFIVNMMAYPVRGLGIATPTFIPPLITAFVALLLSRRRAAPLAYVCGSMGTLIGADLLNLGNVSGLGAPVASIGGAGTFDGIFMTGILAVLLASIATAGKEENGRGAGPEDRLS